MQASDDMIHAGVVCWVCASK